MRNLKKLLAVIITVAMLATLMVPAFAEDTKTAAEICAALGMLKGTTGEVTDEYLATELTRHQMAIMFLRLRGLEAEANAFEGTENFADADEIKYAEGRAVLAYLKANPDLGFVGSEGNFMPLKKVEAQEYFKVMLVALGYKQGEDFEWADVLEFAAEIGLANAADFENNDFLTANDVAEITVAALLAETKDGEVLIEKLIAAEVIDADLAAELGLVEIVEEPGSASVAVTGAKKFTVSFDGAVDESKVTFSVKKGSIVANIKSVTFAEDKKSADLEMAAKLTAGTYTVTIKGLAEDITVSVEVQDEKVADIEFTSDVAPIKRGSDSKEITIGYKVLNQYGEDISNSESVHVNPGKGIVEAGNTVSGGSFDLKADAGFTVNEKVYVALFHPNTGIFKSQEFTVGAESRVTEVSMTKIYHPQNKELVEGGTDNFYIVVEAKDQYGIVIDKPEIVEQDVMVTVFNSNIADVKRLADRNYPDLTGEGDNKVVLVVQPFDDQNPDTTDAYGAGKATVRLMSTSTGKSSTFDIEVKQSAKVNEFTMSQPDLVAAGDQNIEVPFTAIDQFGNEMTADLDGKVQFSPPSGITIGFKKDYVTGKDKLLLSVDSNVKAGSYLITATTGTQKFVTLTISVKEQAVPTVIAGIKDFATIYAKAATATLKAANVIVNDQYGREISLSGNYKIKATTSDAAKVSLSGEEIDDAGKTVTGVAKGSATITLKLYNGNDEIKNSDYTFSVRTVEKDEIANYELADLGKTYHIRGADKKYDVALVVNGLMADGSKVVIPNSSDYFTVIINDSYVGYDSAANTVYSVEGRDFGSATSVDVPVIVNVFGANGPVVLTKNLTVSNEAPAIASLEVATGDKATKIDENFVSIAQADARSLKLAGLVKDAVKAVDQYGKEVTGDAEAYSYMVATNLPDGRDAVELSDVVAGDEFNVLAITKNGLTISFKVIVIK